MIESAPTSASWRVLLSRKYLGIAILLASGVLLCATNEFLTVSLLPSVVADIGGERLYAWVITLYLVGSVMSATTVHWVLQRLGARWSYLFGAILLAVGSLICAVAPSMLVLVAGRAVQGVAGGLLAGLGYALINAALPSSLWTRGSALVSLMWGIATLVGPTVGGVFAQWGIWRWAFGVMVLLALAVMVLVPLALPNGGVGRGGAQSAVKVPVRSMPLLGAAALMVSIAQLPRSTVVMVGLLMASVGLVGAFVMVDRWTSTAVLPPSVFGTGPLKWIYLTMAALMGVAMVDTYAPLFGQRLAHLAPVQAGFLAAVLAVGWTVSEIISASLSNRRIIGRVVASAPIMTIGGLMLAAATQRDNASLGTVTLWALAFLLLGVGIGSAWPHLSAWAMTEVDDPAEGAEAAAAINMVQLIAGAIGAGLAGVVVNAVPADSVLQARWLFTVFIVLAAGGVVTAYRAARQHL